MNPDTLVIVSKAANRTARCDSTPFISLWVDMVGHYELRGEFIYRSEKVHVCHNYTRDILTNASETSIENIGELMGLEALRYAQKKGWAACDQ